MPNEAAKIRVRIFPYLEGKTVLDLGCGNEKIVPWAVGVDDLSEWGPPKPSVDVEAKIDPESRNLGIKLARAGHPVLYDRVFSSHALEHIHAPIPAILNYWMGFVKPGGLLVAYLPDERHYKFDLANPSAKNPAHYHLLTQDQFLSLGQMPLLAVPGIKILTNELRVGNGEYSFLLILMRII